MRWHFEKLQNAVEAFGKEMAKETSDTYMARNLTLREVWNYLLESAAKYPKVENGMICLYKGMRQPLEETLMYDGYTVKIFALDRQNEPIEIRSGRYLGKIIKTKNIDADLEAFMNGEETRIFSMVKGE